MKWFLYLLLYVITNKAYLCVVAVAGGDLCEVSAALHRSRSAAGGAELPGHRHPQSNASGGEVRHRLTNTH